jgi:3-deoxy-D-manno-octulosonate 8-phosphate phosphatase (KDO 8-P phosphatase)
MTQEIFNGTFITDTSIIQQKLKNIKAFLFDWDGVFNDGRKNIDGHSNFSEIDSMGINMMRFSYYLLHNKLPLTLIFTGENNDLAISFAKRENFDFVYYKTSHKKLALTHLCEQYNISPEEILFVFDDVLDFSVAQLAGIRCMVNYSSNPLLKKFAVDKSLVDYITANDGENNAVREVSELVMYLQNNFDETIENRMHFSESYQQYLQLRKNITTAFFLTKENRIIQDINL